MEELSMHRRVLCTIALCGTLALPALAAQSLGARAQSAAAAPVFVRWDPSTNTANLTITAAYNQDNAGFNFDGYHAGAMTITIPTGAKVTVDFTNKASLPHSVVITPYASRTAAGNFPLAFPGSSSANPGTGAASVKTAQTFSFKASKAGTYAIVCGVPGHAIGGMWDVLKVASVSTATLDTGAGLGSTATVFTPIPGGGAMGAMEGDVTDATTGKPVAHAYVVLGWTTLKRVGETDARGHFRIDNVKPISLTDAYGFAEGYVYYHGHPIPIKAGQATTYSFKMPRQTFPDDLLPHMTGATISTMHAKVGDTVTFSAHIQPGKGGPLSAEEFAVNGPLGHSVLLLHAGGDLYRGTWQIPAGTKAGTYRFAFFGAMENCLENKPYGYASLVIG
jgi:sulfocyanin